MLFSKIPRMLFPQSVTRSLLCTSLPRFLFVRFYFCCFSSPGINGDCSEVLYRIKVKLKLMWHKALFKPKSVSLCHLRCVSPMLLAPEAWGEVSQAQAPMGRPVTQHALLLLQCMLVLRPGGVAGRRGPVLLPESPCYKTEHPLIPHSGKCSNKNHRFDSLRFLFPFIIMWNFLYGLCFLSISTPSLNF